MNNLDIAFRAIQEGDLNYAKEVLHAVNSKRLDGNALHLLGLIEAKVGNYFEAKKYLAKSNLILKNSPEIKTNLAIVNRELGFLDEAKKLCIEALDINNNFYPSILTIASIEELMGNFKASINQLMHAQRINNHDLEVFIRLGSLYFQTDQIVKSIENYSKAISIDTNNLIAIVGFAKALIKAGEKNKAIELLKKALILDTSDQNGAQILLSLIGDSELPQKITESHNRKLYAHRSKYWDLGSTYFGHKLVANEVRKFGISNNHKLLDLGCGTGLVGVELSGLGIKIYGVDLSAEMLEKADQKNVYAKLFQADLDDFLEGDSSYYEFITAAATLIHYGKLNKILANIYNRLSPGGIFVFTAFSPTSSLLENQKEISLNLDLAQGGCFFHSLDYLIMQSKLTGFDIESHEIAVHEYNSKNEPINCHLMTLKKPL